MNKKWTCRIEFIALPGNLRVKIKKTKSTWVLLGNYNKILEDKYDVDTNCNSCTLNIPIVLERGLNESVFGGGIDIIQTTASLWSHTV